MSDIDRKDRAFLNLFVADKQVYELSKIENI